MAKSIVAVYETPEETINAIERLTNKGYVAEDFSVVTNRTDTDYLEANTDASIASGDTNESAGFFEKLKSYFTMEDLGFGTNENTKAANLDIPAAELDQFSTELEQGKFLLAVEKEAKEFNANISTDYPEMPPLNGKEQGMNISLGPNEDYERRNPVFQDTPDTPILERRGEGTTNRDAADEVILDKRSFPRNEHLTKE
ncbi:MULTISPECIES: general stress protein [Bacillaceae]|uniref:general stress protein n=1 Tax=Bacillaceae TaxID=186817 RepID=UPI001E3C80C7|nr:MULTISPECIES: general stress protein [Bacillaceae]MCE4050854.1 general stress protein [Bacillus sp. Au-Bac7]MCM3029308.1 general stress protein [Niallia sp. MER 6]MDL0436486.1 general stress protein [Niallia sp. SS-2023]UPO88623.1 general stress protein [Niallia sp. Man26]